MDLRSSGGRLKRIITAAALVLVLQIGFMHVPALAQGETHTVTPGETLYAIAVAHGVTVDALMAANGITNADEVFAGQVLTIPSGGAVSAQSVGSTTHTVQASENLYRISLRYGVTIDALLRANGLTDADQLGAGQVLTIPAGSGNTQPAAQSAPATGGPDLSSTHTIAPGETLSQIAAAYNVSVGDLIALNGLLNPSVIYAGQDLLVPGYAQPTQGYTPDNSSTTYTIQPGESLSQIAARYGVSLWVLSQLNNIDSPSLVYAGQVITIPAGSAPAQPAAQQTAPASNKRIIVDVSDQRAYAYQNGALAYTFIVSTGLPGSDTWRGEFKIQNKIPMAYASTWNLQMPYWMGFYWAGSLQNGFHALPIMSNGVTLWDGYLGSPISYGCVVLSAADAATLYNWTEVGTAVTVRN